MCEGAAPCRGGSTSFTDPARCATILHLHDTVSPGAAISFNADSACSALVDSREELSMKEYTNPRIKEEMGESGAAGAVTDGKLIFQERDFGHGHGWAGAPFWRYEATGYGNLPRFQRRWVPGGYCWRIP